MRASDGDRDEVISRLRKAATEGRIASEELEQRVSAALKARTYDELEATVADLPGTPRRTPSRRHSTAVWAISVVRQNPLLLLVAIPVLAVTTALLLAAAIVWTVLMAVFLIVGGRRMMFRAPWMYGAYRGSGRHRHRSGRGPGSYWA